MIRRFTAVLLVGYSDAAPYEGGRDLPEECPVVDAVYYEEDYQIGMARNLDWVDEDYVRAEITVREEYADHEFELYLCDDEYGPAVWAH